MGWGIEKPLRYIIYIEAEAYQVLSNQQKYRVARLVGELNRCFREEDFMLIGPGRWGSGIPNLGVPVSFAEIHHASVLVEYAVNQAGYMPELSFGTHFFNDLVETGIMYVALFLDGEEKDIKRQLLLHSDNRLVELLPESASYESVIHVVDLNSTGQELYIDIDLPTKFLRAYLESSPFILSTENGV